MAAPGKRDPGVNSYDAGNKVAYLDGNGNGVISAYKDASGNWHSGMMNLHLSDGSAFKPGDSLYIRVETPQVKNFVPAVWLVGAGMPDSPPFPKHVWPDTGEIDINESPRPGYSQSTLHFPSTATWSDGTFKSAAVSSSGSLTAGFHVFRLDWETNSIRVSVDGVPRNVFRPGNLPAGQWAALQHPERLILSMQVGGAWAGNPTAATPDTQMLVDYVRVSN